MKRGQAGQPTQAVTRQGQPAHTGSHAEPRGLDVATHSGLSGNVGNKVDRDNVLSRDKSVKKRSIHNTGGRGINDKPWYYGKFSRQECVDLMTENALVGDFLVRESGSNVGEFSLWREGKYKTIHFRIQTKDGKYFIGQKEKFESLEELVCHYMEKSLSRSKIIFLIKPL